MLQRLLFTALAWAATNHPKGNIPPCPVSIAPPDHFWITTFTRLAWFLAYLGFPLYFVVCHVEEWARDRRFSTAQEKEKAERDALVEKFATAEKEQSRRLEQESVKREELEKNNANLRGEATSLKEALAKALRSPREAVDSAMDDFG